MSSPRINYKTLINKLYDLHFRSISFRWMFTDESGDIITIFDLSRTPKVNNIQQWFDDKNVKS